LKQVISKAQFENYMAGRKRIGTKRGRALCALPL
jgi:hypothetical protein